MRVKSSTITFVLLICYNNSLIILTFFFDDICRVFLVPAYEIPIRILQQQQQQQKRPYGIIPGMNGKVNFQPHRIITGIFNI
jgi:hypothetical protein